MGMERQAMTFMIILCLATFASAVAVAFLYRGKR